MARRQKLNNIEFIKKCIPFADGFELHADQLIFPEAGIETLNDYLLDLKVWKLVWEPLLLQRTIEGLNRANIHWTIWTNQYFKKIFANWENGNNSKSKQYYIGDNIDKAKRKALEYVFDEEAEN